MIARGPQQEMWFNGSGLGKINSATTGGAVTVHSNGTTGGLEVGITGAADGNVYYVLQNLNEIGRLNPITGATTIFSIPTSNSIPVFITNAPNRTLWFTEFNAAKIGKFTY